MVKNENNNAASHRPEGELWTPSLIRKAGYGCTLDWDAFGTGLVSSIHLLGLFSTTVTPFLPFIPSIMAEPCAFPSACRPRCAGQGRKADAETVTTDARNVKPKREEMNVRRWRWLS